MSSFNPRYFEKKKFVLESLYFIENLAESSINKRGSFHFSLCGGSTPAPIFQALAQSKTSMKNWYIYWSDERYLEKRDVNRNESLANKLWLGKNKVPKENIFAIPFTGNIEKDAIRYEILLDKVTFDLSLLGVGEDGHTASLFPENIARDRSEKRKVYPILNSPKPPIKRITVSYEKLIASRNVLFITKEKGKKDALKVMENLQLSPASYISMKSNSKVFIIKPQENA